MGKVSKPTGTPAPGHTAVTEALMGTVKSEILREKPLG